MSKKIIPAARIAQSIYLLRGQKVLLDFDLAVLYGVATKVLNQSVKRNRKRFPDDFMFRLTAEEVTILRSQIVTSNPQDADDQLAKLHSGPFALGIDLGAFRRGCRKGHARRVCSPEPRREIGFHVREKTARYRTRKVSIRHA